MGLVAKVNLVQFKVIIESFLSMITKLLLQAVGALICRTPAEAKREKYLSIQSKEEDWYQYSEGRYHYAINNFLARIGVVQIDQWIDSLQD